MYIYKDVITVEEGKRNGQPCIRGMRIAVSDIFRMLKSGMSVEDILGDFPELTVNDLEVTLASRNFLMDYLNQKLHEELENVQLVKRYAYDDFTRFSQRKLLTNKPKI
jgi:uncharacterized protein (DUF433 family)